MITSVRFQYDTSLSEPYIITNGTTNSHLLSSVQQSVPQPSSLALVAFGALGVGLLAARRRWGFLRA